MIRLVLGTLLGSAQACTVWPNDVRASTSIDQLVTAADSSRTVLVGDIHRTAEPFALFVDLTRALVPRGYRVIAFEGQEDRQPQLDAFLSGKEAKDILKQTFLTAAQRELVVELKGMNDKSPSATPIRILLIDGPSYWNVSSLEQTRDQRMFRHLRKVLDEDPTAKVLAFVGNTHTTEGVQLQALVEGPGKKPDEFQIPSFPLGYYLSLWTQERNLSIRTVSGDEPIGKLALAQLKGQRVIVSVDDSAMSKEVGCVNPGGFLAAALKDAPLGTFTDFIVAVPEFHQMPGERPSK